MPAGETHITNGAILSAGNATTTGGETTTSVTAAPELVLSATGPTTRPLPAGQLAAAADESTTLQLTGTPLFEVGDYIAVMGAVTLVLDISGPFVTLATPVTAPASAPIYRSGTYALTYENVGDADAHDVTLTLPLPWNWLYAAALPTPALAPAVGDHGTLS
jgi:hypothetical protein